MSKKAAQGKKRGANKKGAESSGRKNFNSITNGGIKRLARRAGIKRISADSFGTIRDCAERFVDKVVQHSLLYCECASRQTIYPQDVVYALKLQGRNLYGYVYEKKAKTTTMDEENKGKESAQNKSGKKH